jgi:hypothetical protein
METENAVTGVGDDDDAANRSVEFDPELRLIEACQKLTRLLGPLNVPDWLVESRPEPADIESAGLG